MRSKVTYKPVHISKLSQAFAVLKLTIWCGSTSKVDRISH